MTEKIHRSDIYGDLKNRNEKEASPLIPASTVILLRDGARTDDSSVSQSGEDIEVLMLQKNQNISFGGMWVFPGGRIDDEDYDGEGREAADQMKAALTAAVRETVEETALSVDAEDFVYFAHWTPPPATPKRFSTWFFAAEADNTKTASHHIEVDGEEILNHRWIRPREALALHADGKIDLAPPTWLTLYHIDKYPQVDLALERFRKTEEKIYKTHVAKDKAGVRVAMWHGDAGYKSWDPDVAGERHRLVMRENGFVFENTAEEY